MPPSAPSDAPATGGAPSAWWRRRPLLSTEALLVVVALFFALACNRPFWRGALDGRGWNELATWRFLLAVGLALVALHVFLLALVAGRRWVKPLLALLIVGTGFATYYMQTFTVFLDPSMLRNVLHTDPAEARELLTADLATHLLLYAGLPLLLLWRVRVAARRWPPALLWRAGTLAAALLLLVGAVLLVFQDLSALMRTHRELRYLITPANYLYSLADVAVGERRDATAPRQPVGTDAKLAARWQQRTRPVTFVLVVGETARAENWGLDGYARQTTPELAALPVLNFTQARSCGTNTETSVPCMFSAIGRRDYDEARIRGSESLLHVVHRAGFDVRWIDNQSGCKGVCDGLPSQVIDASVDAALCADGRCLDEALVSALASALNGPPRNRLVVLHMLGNHGPAYYKRYPPPFRRWAPTCDTEELRRCSRDEIVNAYDNAIAYTDHVLARLIGLLNARAADTDAGLLYVSDHGESLGEKGLFLHGVPYAIAPDQQTHVPMILWLSPGYGRDFGIDTACLARRATQPVSHDNLFHSVLGLLDIETAVRAPDWDLSAGCRSPAPVAAAEPATAPAR